MNVLQNLTALYNRLPYDSTYREVAKGILENLTQMEEVTIYDIAEITNSSRTTVWRMVQKMGYKNFSDFRYALQSAVSQYNYYNRMLPIAECKSEEAILAAVSERTMEATTILQKCFTAETMREMVSEIQRAEKIHFYMPFRLAMVEAFQQNLSMDGKETAYYTLLPDMLDASNELNENSIVFISTIEYAETLDMKAVFSKAYDRGAKIWFAGNSRTRYRKYAERMILDIEADSFSWLTALEGMLLALSESYRANSIGY